MPDLPTQRVLLHALTIEEATALAASQSLAEWTFADGYPLPDTTDGVGFFLRHRDRNYGVHLVVRREDGRVIGDGGFVARPPTTPSRSGTRSSPLRAARATRPR